MVCKPEITFKTFQHVNVSFAVGFLTILALSQRTNINEFVVNVLNFFQWPEKISHVMAVCLTWWLPSAIFFMLFRFSHLLDWLKLNRLTQWAFFVANIALLAELAFVLFYDWPSYFTRGYFEAPWKIGLLIGVASMIGCTVWYQIIDRYSLVRNTLSNFLAAN